MEVGGKRHTLAALPPGKIPVPIYRRLGGLQGRSGRVRKISPPPGFDPRTVQPVASRYTYCVIPGPTGYLCTRAKCQYRDCTTGSRVTFQKYLNFSRVGFKCAYGHVDTYMYMCVYIYIYIYVRSPVEIRNLAQWNLIDRSITAPPPVFPPRNTLPTLSPHCAFIPAINKIDVLLKNVISSAVLISEIWHI
jgi:hypothetical protein